VTGLGKEREVSVRKSSCEKDHWRAGGRVEKLKEDGGGERDRREGPWCESEGSKLEVV